MEPALNLSQFDFSPAIAFTVKFIIGATERHLYWATLMLGVLVLGIMKIHLLHVLHIYIYYTMFV